MPDRSEAWELLCEYTKGDSLRKHALAVEAAMRACSKRYNEGSADEGPTDDEPLDDGPLDEEDSGEEG